MGQNSNLEISSNSPKYRFKYAPLPIINITWTHLVTIYGIYLILSGHIYWKTIIFSWIYGFCGQIGVHGGAHRLWSHKSYKAKLPLVLVLVWWQTISGQNSIYEWARDHRVHHANTETDADPHNAKRGLFFSHIGWLMVRKHVDVIAAGKKMDLSDLEDDPVIMFQYRHYKILATIFTFGGPILFTWYFFGESLFNSWVMVVVRYVLSLHGTFLVNSWAHWYGTRPYDKNINPSESIFTSVFSGGEGWHNYHHTFPWDYKTGELGGHRFSTTTMFIDACAKLGLVYGRKSVSGEVVKKRMQRTGDGSS
ncbi:acyl-CoA Delta(11) desaturase [Folsomia candida]|nr:acyl-CoA Delta(11) desaturase [Folsomia candida]